MVHNTNQKDKGVGKGPVGKGGGGKHCGNGEKMWVGVHGKYSIYV